MTSPGANPAARKIWESAPGLTATPLTRPLTVRGWNWIAWPGSGRVSGVAVSPGADSQIFRAAGFAPGDVIVAIDGQPVGSVEQARGLVARAGGEVTVMVDRGGRAIPMRVRLSR